MKTKKITEHLLQPGLNSLLLRAGSEVLTARNLWDESVHLCVLSATGGIPVRREFALLKSGDNVPDDSKFIAEVTVYDTSVADDTAFYVFEIL